MVDRAGKGCCAGETHDVTKIQSSGRLDDARKWCGCGPDLLQYGFQIPLFCCSLYVKVTTVIFKCPK